MARYRLAVWALILATTGVGPAAAGDAVEVRWYQAFDPGGVPWVPGPERNVEEVFKLHRYYGVTRDEAGRTIRVTRYEKGQPVETRTYRVREDGGLDAVDAAEVSPERRGELAYREHCASCHGTGRLGVSGPALLPESLERLKKEEAARVVREGRPLTQMPPFRFLDEATLASVVDYLYSPTAVTPTWTEAQIRGSRQVLRDPATLPARPVHDADPLNLFVVVEAGDHHLTVLDGDRLVPIHRGPTHFALHGGPKYSPDGRYVYLASRDGWVTKYDLYALAPVVEVRAAINTRNLAVSEDGRYVAVGNYLPRTLVLLDAADLSLLEVIPVAGADGTPSRVSAVYQAAPRKAFIVALKDVSEAWEVRYAEAGFPVRRITLQDVLDDFLFDPSYRYLLGASRKVQRGQVLDLDSGKRVTDLDLPGMPHLASGISWERGGERVMATPNLREGAVSVIRLSDWRLVKRVETLGPGFFLRSHEESPYAWVDNSFSRDRDALQVIDKSTLEVVKTLRPSPGKTAAHVEFDRYGKHALVSVMEVEGGAVVVYDANTLEEVKRLPMVKPSGKYNVYNKTRRSEGTSH
jgi:hypothetical protein